VVWISQGEADVVVLHLHIILALFDARQTALSDEAREA
jgi:hypothetical protein